MSVQMLHSGDGGLTDTDSSFYHSSDALVMLKAERSDRMMNPYMIARGSSGAMLQRICLTNYGTTLSEMNRYFTSMRVSIWIELVLVMRSVYRKHW